MKTQSDVEVVCKPDKMMLTEFFLKFLLTKLKNVYGYFSLKILFMSTCNELLFLNELIISLKISQF